MRVRPRGSCDFDPKTGYRLSLNEITVPDSYPLPRMDDLLQSAKHTTFKSTIDLNQADFTKPFVLRTDASNYALGAVLLQGPDMEEHPIEYASRLLNSAERNYSTTEREALVVVWVLNKFRGYREGSKITVASDHQPLKWLMKLKSPSGRVYCRYSHDSKSEEAQLVVPSHERDKIVKEHHDSPNAAHYGSDGTYQRIAKRYFCIGMRKFITNYAKNCLDCARLKASNQKPAGLLQTPVQAQRFEIIEIDLFGPLPESKDKKKWIFIVEDVATRWAELFALTNATPRECATVLMEQWVTLKSHQRQRYPICLRCYATTVLSSENPPIIYSGIPSTSKSCRKKKPCLAILVENQHDSWCEKLPSIRFAMNTADWSNCCLPNFWQRTSHSQRGSK
ncbi:Retrovirus-related Pol polyprotein from transposon 297 [Araneus ventricosus]|uniref:RNA-directed DNA polymerase n=1 Tax=Araneus ventricosus TaxID=182803 RepID=A0A4Y2AAE5_ARAVE|nr:Retrovirus-related Pol polyprotein from transposon 297 [Araneus ventricosus]